MKSFCTLFFALVSLCSYAQDKSNYIRYNNLLEIKDSEYVIATIDEKNKIDSKNNYLLFINTANGQSFVADLPKHSKIHSIQPVLVDDKAMVVVVARTIDLNNKSSIDWSDPMQIILFSQDGSQKNQLTDNEFFAQHWTYNFETKTLIVVGHFDSNKNGKYDKKDKNEILIYDLTTMKLKSKI